MADTLLVHPINLESFVRDCDFFNGLLTVSYHNTLFTNIIKCKTYQLLKEKNQKCSALQMIDTSEKHRHLIFVFFLQLLLQSMLH